MKHRRTMMKKTKLYLKLTALMLSLVMLIFSSSLGAFAVDNGNMAPSADSGVSLSEQSATSTDSQVSFEASEFISSERIGNVIEITDRREENVKHFSLPDGTVEAIVYSRSVHRKDTSGAWQDIDNTLAATRDGVYSTSDGRISFSQSIPALTISENGYKVSMTYTEKQIISSGKDPSAGRVENTEPTTFTSSISRSSNKRGTVFDTLEEAIKVDNKSALTYRSDKSKIEYILDGNNVKENIIIDKKASAYEYYFNLSVEGLKAILSDNGDILLNDGKETKYTIPAPYMYDAEGNISYDAEYELTVVKEGSYLIRLTASSEWINSADRVFPITLDPSINSDSDLILDAHVSSATPTTNYHDSTYLEVGNGRISYIYIIPPQLPSDITVNSAFLNTYYYYCGYSGSATVGLHRVTEYWAENEITYNNRPTYESSTISTSSTYVEPEYPEHNAMLTSISIMSAVTNWMSQSPMTNYGFALTYQSGSISSPGYIRLISSESSMDMGAYISINYTYDLIDGVYALKNAGASNRWMAVELADGSIVPTENANIQQKFSSAIPSNGDVFDRQSLFKISKVAEATATEGARYVIRSMLDNSMSFYISGSEVLTKKIPLDDSSVAASDTFYIEAYNGRYFYIRPYGSTKVINLVNSSTADLNTIEKTSAKSNARWEIYRYTGSHVADVTIYGLQSWPDTGIEVKSSGTIAAKSLWSTYPDAGDPYIELHSDYTDMGDFAWDENTLIGTFRAENIGAVKFVVKITYANGQTAQIATFTLQIIPQEGTYYIENSRTGRHVETGPWSDTPNSDVYQSNFGNGNNFKWTIEHVAGFGGYVRIKSIYSEYYLGIDETDTTSVIEKNVISNSTDPHILWKIDRTSNGNTKLTCKATESLGYVLAGSTQTTETQLNQITYSDNSIKNDEWNVYVYKDASFIALPEIYDRTSFFEDSLGYLEDIGYTDNYDNEATIEYGMTKKEFIDRMAYSRITVVRTHGTSSYIKMSDGDFGLMDLMTNFFYCSELVIYGSCLTAEGGDNGLNFASRTAQAGVRTVIGFENSVPARGCNEWCRKFFELYNAYYNVSGKDIANICEEVDRYMKNETNLYSGWDAYGNYLTLEGYVVAGEKSFP